MMLNLQPLHLVSPGTVSQPQHSHHLLNSGQTTQEQNECKRRHLRPLRGTSSARKTLIALSDKRLVCNARNLMLWIAYLTSGICECTGHGIVYPRNSGALLSALASASAFAALLGLLGLEKRGVSCWMLLIALSYAEAMLLAEADAGDPPVATELALAGDPLVELELALAGPPPVENELEIAGPPFVETDLLLAGDPLVPIAFETAGEPSDVATLDTAGAPFDLVTVWGVADTTGLGDATGGRGSTGRGEGLD